VSYRDSLPVEGTLVLIGVWIHDPDDPAGTIQNYPYGASARERTVDTMPAGNFYAGRQSPVVDFGEFEGEAVSFTVQIPHGATWRDDVARVRALASQKQTMLYRDNRGRVLPGILSGYREADQDWGTAVSFTVTRVDSPPPIVAVA
jgi:hypothetical protein